MNTRNLLPRTAAFFAAAILASCSSRPEVAFTIPEEPGIYAIRADAELQRLNGTREWELKTWPQRSNLDPHLEFVVYEPALARSGRPPQELVQLWKVAWVRSEIKKDGSAMPVSGSSWAVAEIERFQVPLAADRAPRQPDVVRLTPRTPLEPGLYSLKVRKGSSVDTARIGVQWESVDKRAYSAANCVDLYSESGNSYRACDDIAEELNPYSADGLKIALVKPHTQSGKLVIQGVITNKTERTKQIPPLRAALLDNDGNETAHWIFTPDIMTLGPEEQVSFRTETDPPRRGGARVRVTFLPVGESSMR